MYPQFSTNNARVRTFACWPAISKQKAEDLSNTGFFLTDKSTSSIKASLLQKNFLKPSNVQMVFVTGNEVHITCFHCGLILGDWEEADSAWREHAKYRPNCLYMIHIKGTVFVLKSAQAF